jgi:hypothetical protein
VWLSAGNLEWFVNKQNLVRSILCYFSWLFLFSVVATAMVKTACESLCRSHIFGGTGMFRLYVYGYICRYWILYMFSSFKVWLFSLWLSFTYPSICSHFTHSITGWKIYCYCQWTTFKSQLYLELYFRQKEMC